MEKKFIPYGRQSISEDDIEAVANVLRSDWITQGPAVIRFEQALTERCGARYAVAVSSGTAALHLAAMAAGFAEGDEVITSPITFIASANCIVYTGAQPVFADIDDKTYCIDHEYVKKCFSPKTKGIIPVHFAGQPCDMPALYKMAKERGVVVIEDAAHALGSSYTDGRRTYQTGSCAHSDMAIFSFHPVKHITTGEGGAIMTNDESLYRKLLRLRTHGIVKEASLLTRDEGPWYYEINELGFNYRITDLQCALGTSQIEKLDSFVKRRREIAEKYSEAFKTEDRIVVPFERAGVKSSYHIYVLQFKASDRLKVFRSLWKKGLGVSVHYIPVHLQPYYARKFGFRAGNYPKAEEYYSRAITIPLYPGMTDGEADRVITTVLESIGESPG